MLTEKRKGTGWIKAGLFCTGECASRKRFNEIEWNSRTCCKCGSFVVALDEVQVVAFTALLIKNDELEFRLSKLEERHGKGTVGSVR